MLKASELIKVKKAEEKSGRFFFCYIAGGMFFGGIGLLLLKEYSLIPDPKTINNYEDVAKLAIYGILLFSPTFFITRKHLKSFNSNTILCPECQVTLNDISNFQNIIISRKCPKCFKIIVEDDINNPPCSSA